MKFHSFFVSELLPILLVSCVSKELWPKELTDGGRKPCLFVNIHDCVCCLNSRMAICYGEYPDFLLEAWDDYDFRKHSDNDRPGKTHKYGDMIDWI